MKYELITRRGQLADIARRIVDKPDAFLAFDTETHGPTTDWVKIKSKRYVWELTAHLTGFSFAFEDTAYYIPIAHRGANYPEDDFRKFLRWFFALPNRIWGHNLDYDFRIIRNFMGEYLIPKRYGDTMVLCWLLGKAFVKFQGGKPIEFYGLKDLTKNHFQHDMLHYEDLMVGMDVMVDGPSSESIATQQLEFLLEMRKHKPELFPGLPPGKREAQRLAKLEKTLIKTRTYREAQMNDLTGEYVCQYGCEDAYWTLQLAVRFWPGILDMRYQKTFDDVEMKRLMVLRRIHDNGMPVSLEVANDIREQCRAICEPLEREFFDRTGVNIRSGAQLAELFYRGIPRDDIEYTKSGVPATDQDNLSRLKNKTPGKKNLHELIDIKIKHATYFKVGSTYTDSLVKQLPFSPDGRIHPRLNMTRARTGRLSSSDPNAQNLPGASEGMPNVRDIVCAPKGYVIANKDYGQIEIVVLAHLSKDAALTDIVLSGKSMHDVTAEALGITRKEAKTVNFLKNYGGGSKKLAIGLNVPLEKDGDYARAPQYIQNYCDKYDELYSGVTQFRDDMSAFAYKHGYIETVFGRRRMMPEVRSLTDEVKALSKKIYRGIEERKSGRWCEQDERILGDMIARKKKITLELYHAQRVCSNTPIQGTAAGIVDRAMIAVDAYLEGTGGQMIMQVHDELVFLLPEEKAEKMLDDIGKIMEDACRLSLPVKTDGKIGSRWGDCK